MKNAKIKGFTLIELLTIISIIGIIAAVVIPTVGKVRETAVKEAAKEQGISVDEYKFRNGKMTPSERKAYIKRKRSGDYESEATTSFLDHNSYIIIGGQKYRLEKAD